MKKLLAAALIALVPGLVLAQSSTVDPTKPASNSGLSSSVLRQQFQSVYNDITSLYTSLSNLTINALNYTAAGTGAAIRLVSSKLGDNVSVLDYGAKCDGIADDGPAFQKAVIAAAIRKTPLSVPLNGTSCLINTQVVLPSNIQLVGVGGDGIGSSSGGTIANIKTTAPNAATFVSANNSGNIVIRGLSFQHDGSGRIIDLTNSQSNKIEQNVFRASNASGTGELVYTNGSNTFINNNFFVNNRAGQWTVNFDRTSWGMNINDWFTGNAVQGSGNGVRIGAASTTPTGTTTNGSTTVSGLSSTTNLSPSLMITGTGIPQGTTIASVGTTSLVLSQAATASGTITLTAYQPRPEGVKSSNNSYTITGCPALQIEQTLLFQSVNDTFDIGCLAGNPQVYLTNTGFGNEALTFQGDWFALESSPVNGLCIQSTNGGYFLTGISIVGNIFDGCGYGIVFGAETGSVSIVGNIIENSGSLGLGTNGTKQASIIGNSFRANRQEVSLIDAAAGGPYVMQGNTTDGSAIVASTTTVTTPSKFVLGPNPNFPAIFNPGVTCSGTPSAGFTSNAQGIVTHC